MTIFLRHLADKTKAEALLASCLAFRTGAGDPRLFQAQPDSFLNVPGAPFAYWVSKHTLGLFHSHEAFEYNGRATRVGMQTSDDFRFVRVKWEPSQKSKRWYPFAKGGSRSTFYSDIVAMVNWFEDGQEIKAWADPLYGNSGWSRIIKSTDFYFRPGLTWPLRGVRFSSQAVPSGCAFSVAGKMAFTSADDLTFWLALFNSAAFDYLIRIFAGKVGGVQYEVGLVARIPVINPGERDARKLSELARHGWSLRRALYSTDETSQAFALPAALGDKFGTQDAASLEAELARVQAKIDEITFDLYGFSETDRNAALQTDDLVDKDSGEETEGEDEDRGQPMDHTDALLSWAVGVAYGRFDWRLATGEREVPPEPDPFDPILEKSPGMLPDGAEPFHDHSGILVDDQGHPHDLARLIEEVLTRVETDVPGDVRRWLQRDFFSLHLKQYSKSRRKAPIYWPLSTTLGSYTLWLYYPSLTSQTLYTAVNDFVEPKLKQVSRDIAMLRDKGASRTRDDEKAFEALQTLELELIELHDTLLRIAPTYRPNHDDGVQITAAPLWPLFRHKPWQKVLKDTWAKLEKGDYDWAHLAMVYWPDRVREKCKTDKSLAIAHDLEDLYEPAPSTEGGKKKKKSSGA